MMSRTLPSRHPPLRLLWHRLRLPCHARRFPRKIGAAPMRTAGREYIILSDSSYCMCVNVTLFIYCLRLEVDLVARPPQQANGSKSTPSRRHNVFNNHHHNNHSHHQPANQHHQQASLPLRDALSDSSNVRIQKYLDTWSTHRYPISRETSPG